jgi:GLPGLI family protein
MKYFKVIIIYLFIYSNCNSQNVIIEYNTTINTNEELLSTSTNYTLLLNKKESNYFNNFKDSINQFKFKNIVDVVKEVGDVIMVEITDNMYSYIRKDFFYKNYEKDTLIYNEIISVNKQFVGEKINLFDWEILPNSNITVLGFKCQVATTEFRGRKYEAVFCQEIAPYGGPWKFDGLPGLILSVRSLDNYFVIIPTKIILNGKDEKIFNPYENKKIISWNEFKEKFRLHLVNQLKRMKAMSEIGEGGSIKVTEKIEDLELPEMKF